MKRASRSTFAMGLALVAGCTDLGESPPIGPIPDTRIPGSIAIASPASPAEVSPGGTLRFTAAVLDTAGNPMSASNIGWNSDNPNVASIDATGLARGIAPGEASIRASITALTSPPVVLRVVQTVPNFTTEVQPIFNASCASAACHGNQAGLTLTAGVSYAEIVNVPATQSALLRVAPGDPAQSFLYLKITGCTPPACVGDRMPRGAAPLPAAQIETIREWIAGGAPP